MKVVSFTFCLVLRRGKSYLACSSYLSDRSLSSASSSSSNDFDDFTLEKSSNDGPLQITFNQLKLEKPFCIDFINNKNRIDRPREELVVKAVGKSDLVVDLTAGLGRDSMLIASTGQRLCMIERNPTLYRLLYDGLYRYVQTKSDLDASLYNIDSTNRTLVAEIVSKHFYKSPEELAIDKNITVYLDPMYPSGLVGKSSLVKKETQVLHRLVGSTEGEDQSNNLLLFQSAIHIATSRIVVKRPIKSPPLCDIPPHNTIKGTKQRFDVYFMNRNIAMPKEL